MVYSKSKSFRCNTYKKHGGETATLNLPIPRLRLHSTFNCRSKIPTLSGLSTSYAMRRPTEHGSRATRSSVPLQPEAFGATIGKGTRFLLDPRKQLRSPRCLRLLGGHREPFDGVPGYPDSVGVAS